MALSHFFKLPFFLGGQRHKDLQVVKGAKPFFQIVFVSRKARNLHLLENCSTGKAS